MTLFNEHAFFDYQFPEPQYLGAKYVLLPWLRNFIPSDVRCAVDAFSGSQSVAYLFKQLGIRTLTNDFLRFNHQIGLALIENKSEQLSDEELQFLVASSEAHRYSLMRETFTGVFFDEEQATFLDAFRHNVTLLDNPHKQALALAAMNRSLTRKITMGHFAHTQALNYASSPERIRRNRSLVRPIRDIFLELAPKYNRAVFDNGCDNKSYGENILELLPQLRGENIDIDMVYFDPPYCDSHADYQNFYHLLETYTEYWRDKQFVNTIKRYEPQRISRFDKKREIMESLKTLFEFASDIPHWLISYNDRSYPSPQDLARMITPYKQVQIESRPYLNGRGGKGSVAGSHELLFVCKDNPRFHVQFSMITNKQPFEHWQKLYEQDELQEFTFSSSGLLWLKIKSIARKEYLGEFITSYYPAIGAGKLGESFEKLYEMMNAHQEDNHSVLNEFIRRKSIEQADAIDTERLVSELYKLRHFDWGGDYKNALDRYLVDHYVKVYQSYDTLISKFDSEIQRAVQGYVLCSWYNHWSSIVIEHVFKSHPIVLPTVGQIKKVDFFVNNIPFDLKVTYLPANYIEKKRKERGLQPELTELKQKAKQIGITFGASSKAGDVYYEIVEKMKDRNDEACREILEQMRQTRLDILREAQENPRMLIQNLYEEQGELRFDASNRLFLVLVDTEDFDNSWKLKRNLNMMKPSIEQYLNTFTTKTMDDLQVRFRYKNRSREYAAWSDIIFVVK